MNSVVPAGAWTRRRPLVAGATAAAGAACLWLVDPTTGSVGLPCAFRAVTGFDCPLCGATRATWALVHAEPARALGYNALWVAFVPLVLWAWALDVRGGFDGSQHPFRRRAFWTGAMAVGVAFAVVRNLPWDPWRALGT